MKLHYARIDPDRWAEATAMAGYGATALHLVCTEQRLEFRAWPGFSQHQKELPGEALTLMNKPSDWLHFPIAPDSSWRSRAFAYGAEELWATTRVLRMDAAIDAPAGSFQGCAVLETVLERTGQDADESHRRLNLRNSGVRTAYLAPGVGIVRIDFEHGDGLGSHARLTAFTVPEATRSFVPLIPGTSWEYEVTNSSTDYVIRDRYRVVDRDGDSAYVAEYFSSEKATG